MKKNKTIRIGYQLFLLSFVIGHLSLTSCTDTGSSNDLVTFSGSVTLEGAQDMSGVTVSLYAPVELDTALTRINEQYPNIGVRISQETEFDHREQTPLATTTTDANGKWKIEGPKGSYNIVFEKEGYGWKYILEESSTNVADIDLYKEQVVPAVVGTDFVFEDGKFYVIKGDVSILGKATFQKAIIVAEKSARLILLGDVASATGGGFTFLTARDRDEIWNGVELDKDNASLAGLHISYARNAIEIKSNNNLVEKCYLKNSTLFGVSASSGRQNLRIRNILANTQDAGFSSTALDSTNLLEKSLFYNSVSYGMLLNQVSMVLRNSIFLKNNTGLQAFFDSDLTIENCRFESNSKYQIELGGSDPAIRYNNFSGKSEIVINLAQLGYGGSNNPVINYNNITGGDNYAVYMYGNRPNPNAFDIDARHNWWGTNNNQTIKDIIRDKADISVDDPGYAYTGYILWEPAQTASVAGAGIEN